MAASSKALNLLMHSCLSSAWTTSRREAATSGLRSAPYRVDGRKRSTSSRNALDVLEMAVHRGITHICHFVELVQLFHHEFANLPRSHFALAEAAQFARGCARPPLPLPRGSPGVFSSALCSPPRNLPSSKGTRRWSFFTTSGITSSAVFKSGEALAAFETLAAAADLRAFGRESRVVDLGVWMRAEGTVHGTPSTLSTDHRPDSAGTARKPRHAPFSMAASLPLASSTSAIQSAICFELAFLEPAAWYRPEFRCGCRS